MRNGQKIRVSDDLKEIIDWIRAKCLLNGVKCPSITVVTRVLSKKLDKEKIWNEEFNKI